MLSLFAQESIVCIAVQSVESAVDLFFQERETNVMGAETYEREVFISPVQTRVQRLLDTRCSFKTFA